MFPASFNQRIDLHLQSLVNTLPQGVDVHDARVVEVVREFITEPILVPLEPKVRNCILLVGKVSDQSIQKVQEEGKENYFYSIMRVIDHVSIVYSERIELVLRDLFSIAAERKEINKAKLALSHIHDVENLGNGESLRDVAIRNEDYDLWLLVHRKSIQNAILSNDSSRLYELLSIGETNSLGYDGSFYYDAIHRNDIEAVQLLIDFEVPLEGEGVPSGSVIECAFEQGEEEIVLLLLRYERRQFFKRSGVSDNRHYQWNPIYFLYASTLSSLKLLKLLAPAADVVGIKDYKGRNALFYALRRHLKIDSVLITLHYLESLGLSLNTTDNHEHTLLHKAAGHSTPDIVLYLVQRGVFTHALDNKSRTPLLVALQHGRFDNAKVLLEQEDPGVNVANNLGYTPLFYALAHQESEPELVIKVLEKGAFVDFLPGEACPTLKYIQLALRLGCPHVVGKILDKMAFITIQTDEEKALFSDIVLNWSNDLEWNPLLVQFYDNTSVSP